MRSEEKKMAQYNRTMTPKTILILYRSIKIILHKDTGELCLAENIFNESKKDR